MPSKTYLSSTPLPNRLSPPPHPPGTLPLSDTLTLFTTHIITLLHHDLSNSDALHYRSIPSSELLPHFLNHHFPFGYPWPPAPISPHTPPRFQRSEHTLWEITGTLNDILREMGFWGDNLVITRKLVGLSKNLDEWLEDLGLGVVEFVISGGGEWEMGVLVEGVKEWKGKEWREEMKVVWSEVECLWRVYWGEGVMVRWEEFADAWSGNGSEVEDVRGKEGGSHERASMEGKRAKGIKKEIQAVDEELEDSSSKETDSETDTDSTLSDSEDDEDFNF